MINNLRAKILIRIDILIFKDIDLAILISIGYINSYRTKFTLTVLLLRPFIKRDVTLKKPISIPTKSYIAIAITY